MQLYSTVICLQVPRLMVSGHHLQQKVLLPGRNLPRRHCGNDRGRDQRPDQSAQRGMMTTRLLAQWQALNYKTDVFVMGLFFVVFRLLATPHWLFCRTWVSFILPEGQSGRPRFHSLGTRIKKGKEKKLMDDFGQKREWNTLKYNLLLNSKHYSFRKLTGGK